jgi:SAM-dependent methyltransferase
LAENGAEVFAIDISGSIEVAKSDGKHLSGLHVLQADLFRLPLPDSVFDVVWSDGVIHHTPNPWRAFSALASKVAVGGRLIVYVYPQELSIYKRVRSWMPRLDQWPLPMLRTFCSITAVPIYAARIMARTYQPYGEVKFRLFDTVSCPYLSMHSADEVTGWFQENGFHQIAIGKPDITAFGIKAP